MAFLGYPRGHRIDPETGCCITAHRTPNERMDTLPRTRASPEPMGHHRGVNLGDHLSSVQRSSCLRLQLFRVETSLLLPECQSNGRDLSASGQTRPLGLHALSQQSHIEVARRSYTTAGSGRGSLEDLFHFVVVILIETTNLLRFFRTLQLSVHVAILRTVAGLNAQPTIGPELPFAPEPVRRLHQRDQAGGSDRTDAGNLT